MAYGVYSELLAQALSVPDSPTNIGVVETGHTWVLRSVTWTFGSYLGYVRGAIQVGDEEPGLWLCGNPSGVLAGVAKFSSSWEGRIVVPEGVSLYAYASSGDTGDISVSGYNLTNV